MDISDNVRATCGFYFNPDTPLTRLLQIHEPKVEAAKFAGPPLPVYTSAGAVINQPEGALLPTDEELHQLRRVPAPIPWKGM
jgi:hypothetical protein